MKEADIVITKSIPLNNWAIDSSGGREKHIVIGFCKIAGKCRLLPTNLICLFLTFFIH